MTNPAANRITTALTDAIRAHELGTAGIGIPTRWTLVGNYLDGDGTLRTMLLNSDGQTPEDTLGLLETGRIAVREQIRRRLFPTPPAP